MASQKTAGGGNDRRAREASGGLSASTAVARQTVRSASVGDSWAARIAGRSPAIAPIRIAAARPPAHALVGGRRRLAHLDLVRRLGVRGRGEDRLDGGGPAGDAAHVDDGRMAVEPEPALRSREAASTLASISGASATVSRIPAR